MVKLICQGCGTIWYSSCDMQGQTCDDCSAILKVVNLKEEKEEQIHSNYV
jgi:hypothetical protein